MGVPVILLRYLNPPKLCNGTRLRVLSLQKNVIEGSIISGYRKVNVREQRAKAQTEKTTLPLFVPKQVSLNQIKASIPTVQPEPIPSTSQSPQEPGTQTSPDLFTQLRDPEVVDLFQGLQDFIQIAKNHNARSARLSALFHYVYNDIIQ
ncbi:hypothetical protein TNCV_252601 [Trichonephila clavipes]|nr:hypothetical protein TNCV_252601 [Trichonephila clavipes]